MNTKLFKWAFISLLSLILFFPVISCDSGSSNGDGSSSGTITVEISTPGFLPGEYGYQDYTGTLTVEDGNMTEYELTGRRFIGMADRDIVVIGSNYYAMRYKITRTVSREADGLFAGIAEATRELQYFYLETVDEEVPPFDPEGRGYEKGKGEFQWDANRLLSFTGYGMEGEVWIPGSKDVYEYYGNGKLESIRNADWDGESFYFSEAEWYSNYDTTFTDFPSLTWEFYASYEGDDPSIPESYNYATNPNVYDKQYHTQYSYTADSNGRIGTVIQQNYETGIRAEPWVNELKIEVSYDSSGNVSTVKLYFDDEGWPEDPTMQMDFSIPSGLGLSFEGLFFPPWNEVLFPFFEDGGAN